MKHSSLEKVAQVAQEVKEGKRCPFCKKPAHPEIGFLVLGYTSPSLQFQYPYLVCTHCGIAFVPQHVLPGMVEQTLKVKNRGKIIPATRMPTPIKRTLQ